MVSEKSIQRKEIVKLISAAIRDDTLNFSVSNREKRRKFYAKVIKNYTRGSELLLELIGSIGKSFWVSRIGSKSDKSYFDRQQSEMDADIVFLKEMKRA